MLGRSHAITGLAIGSLAAVTIPNLATTPTGWITTCIATGGAALLPDLDHSGTTVSKSLGPITQTASTLTNKLFGGHRNGTHSIIGWLIFTTLATLAAIPTITLPLPTNTPDWLPKHVSPGAITIYAWPRRLPSDELHEFRTAVYFKDRWLYTRRLAPHQKP